MMIIHNTNTFKLVLLLLLCRGIMAHNTDRYILILGESVCLLVILKIRAVAISILIIRSELTYNHRTVYQNKHAVSHTDVCLRYVLTRHCIFVLPLSLITCRVPSTVSIYLSVSYISIRLFIVWISDPNLLSIEWSIITNLPYQYP